MDLVPAPDPHHRKASILRIDSKKGLLQNAPFRHCEAPKGAVAIRIPLRLGTDSHDQRARWSRNDGVLLHFATAPFLTGTYQYLPT